MKRIPVSWKASHISPSCRSWLRVADIDLLPNGLETTNGPAFAGPFSYGGGSLLMSKDEAYRTKVPRIVMEPMRWALAKIQFSLVVVVVVVFLSMTEFGAINSFLTMTLVATSVSPDRV